MQHVTRCIPACGEAPVACQLDWFASPCICTTGDGGSTPRTTTNLAMATIANGTQQVALPNYVPLPANAVGGTAAHLDGECVVADSNISWIEAKGYFLHNYGSWVIFGYSVNGGPVVEGSRLQINSNDPTLGYLRAPVNVKPGDRVCFFISSNFEWSSFGWSNLDIQMLG